MKSRLPLFIAGAAVVHIIAFVIMANWRVEKPRHIPRQNFNGYEEITYDDKTGEKITYREFVVSTKLYNAPSPESSEAQ
jgi:hypothetical protein